jgi:hypothetical protein
MLKNMKYRYVSESARVPIAKTLTLCVHHSGLCLQKPNPHAAARLAMARSRRAKTAGRIFKYCALLIE